MKDATHHVAVAALIANVPQIKLLVRHDAPPQGLQVRIRFLFSLGHFLHSSSACWIFPVFKMPLHY